MAKDKNADEKQVDDEEENPNKEVFLEKKERDPDEAVFAEQAILHYASDVMDVFQDQVSSAMSQVESFLTSQTQKEELDSGFFLEGLGDTFLDQIMNVFGGAGSPLAQAVFPMLDGAVDQGMRGNSAQAFVNGLSSQLRDVSSYVKDNLQSVLSNQWDELRDLAYEGSTDFIAALHAYGLPQIDFDPSQLSAPMIDQSQQFLDTLPQQKEEKVEQDQLAQFEEQEEKMEEPEVKNLVEEEEKKQAVI